MYDALRLKLRSTTLQPAPAAAPPPPPVQPAAPAVDARSEGRSGGGRAAGLELGPGQGGAPAAGESSSDAMEGAFGSTADEPKPMDE